MTEHKRQPLHLFCLCLPITSPRNKKSRLSSLSVDNTMPHKTFHGHQVSLYLQLKCQKLRVGGYMEKELKLFNYPRTRAHPGCEGSCQRYQIDLHSRFVEASPTVEKAVSCYKADRLVASLYSLSVMDRVLHI